MVQKFWSFVVVLMQAKEKKYVFLMLHLQLQYNNIC